MAETNQPCQVRLSTVFIYDSPQVQNAATTVFNYKTLFDANPGNSAVGRVYNFKTDAERIQYKLGQFASTSRG